MELSTREKAIIVTALTILGLDDKREVRATREEIESISWKFLKQDGDIKFLSIPEGF